VLKRPGRDPYVALRVKGSDLGNPQVKSIQQPEYWEEPKRVEKRRSVIAILIAIKPTSLDEVSWFAVNNSRSRNPSLFEKPKEPRLAHQFVLA
jgi:hypothetical protein